MLFIHAIGINLGGYISDNARAAQTSQRPQTEMVASHGHGDSKGQQPQAQQGHSHGDSQGQQPQGQQPQAQQGHGDSKGQQPQAQQGHGHGRPQPFKFAEIEISRNDKRLINMVILVLIYGSYLYFRLRKAKQSRERKQAQKVQ